MLVVTSVCNEADLCHELQMQMQSMHAFENITNYHSQNCLHCDLVGGQA